MFCCINYQIFTKLKNIPIYFLQIILFFFIIILSYVHEIVVTFVACFNAN